MSLCPVRCKQPVCPHVDDGVFEIYAEASISHRNPRDPDVETLLHQLRNSDIRVSAALAAENLGGPVEKYLAIVNRCQP
jgi:hypothetical protein